MGLLRGQNQLHRNCRGAAGNPRFFLRKYCRRSPFPIKSNPELAGKNRRGVASRTITPDGSLREAIEDYKVRSPAEVASQEVTPEEELSADGTATVSQPLTHTDIEATPGDILDVDGKTTGPSIIRVGHHNAPTVDAEELADPEEANSQSAGNVQSSPLLIPEASAPRCSGSPPKPSTVPAARAATAPSKLSSSAPATLPAAHPVR